MHVLTEEKTDLETSLHAPVHADYRLKRLVDVVGALAGVLLFAPFFPLIALAIRLDSRGSILVALDRVSEGRVIKVYKFRSMIKGAHALKPDLAPYNERSDGPFFKMRHDPRITRVGRILRKFRIDEVPQLLNVLRGELSLVGPRPHEPEEVAHYPAAYRHLTLARAGVTGLSQVSGASSLAYHEELQLDDHYVRNTSLGLDMKIIAKTAKIMFSDPTAV